MLLHQKIELHTALLPEEAAAVLRTALSDSGSGFHGTEQNGEFRADYKEKGLNAFRPELRLSLLPEEEGCLIWADLRLPAVMLAFMLLWTVMPVGFAVFGHNWLALAVIPVFWAIALIAFRMGVKSAKQALMALLDAYEETD